MATPLSSTSFLSRYSVCALLICLSLIINSCKKNGDSPDRDPRGVVVFTHPGILNTAASLNFISNDANTAGSWREEMFENTVDGYIERNINSMQVEYPAIVYIKTNGGTPTEDKMRIDCQLAYALALKWAKTGDTIIAEQSIEILNNWARTFRRIDTVPGSSSPNRYLEAAWVLPTFAAAGEIMRWYNVNDTHPAIWQVADIKQFEVFLKLMMNDYSDKILTLDYRNNWYSSAAYARMAVGVFLSDVTIYNSAYNSLKAVILTLINKDGALRELCMRADCHHFQYSLTGLTFGADIDKIQSGSNELYEYGNRLRKGYMFMQTAYEGGVDGCNYCDPNKVIYPGVAVAYRYFNNSNTNYLTTLRQPSLGVVGDRTFLGFTMYTHYNVP